MTTLDVVVPTYRRPAQLALCLAALAGQTVPADQVIVVVRSEDAASGRVAEGFRGRLRGLALVQVGRPGVIAALTVGTAHSAGDIVAFTDDDAAPRSDWVERLLSHLADPSVGAVGGRDLIPGSEGPPHSVVGTFQRSARLVGNHHVGSGPPRDVDVLKGVNMAFRADVLALPREGVLRGSGAQVSYEVLMCARVRQKGWRVVYDPAVLVDHEGAPRPGPDRRVRPPSSTIRDAAYNSLVAACLARPAPQALVLAHAIIVGTRGSPGFARSLAAVARREVDVLRCVPAALSGQVLALLGRTRSRSLDELMVSAGELRATHRLKGVPSP